MTSPTPFPIDLAVDLVCPWCLIGEARLSRALAMRPELEATVTVRPFLLDPSVPPEGRDLREWLGRRYGKAPDEMFGRVESVAREVGIPLDFAKVRRIPNTLGGHVLIAHAKAKGTQTTLTKALFDAYFLEGADLSITDELAKVAVHHGFERDEVRTLVEDEAERDRIRDEAGALGRKGVSGVPFFVFGGTHALSGAHPEETILRAIDAALADVR